MDPVQIQGAIIIVLSLGLGLCLLMLWRSKEARPLYRAECEAMDAALKAELAMALAAHELRVSGLLAELSVKQTEAQRLRDKRDADRDRVIADIQLVLKTKFRFQP